MTGWKTVARMPVEALQLLQQMEQQQKEQEQEEEEEHAGQTGQYRGVSENDRHEILEVKCHSNKRCDWDV